MSQENSNQDNTPQDIQSISDLPQEIQDTDNKQEEVQNPDNKQEEVQTDDIRLQNAQDVPDGSQNIQNEASHLQFVQDEDEELQNILSLPPSTFEHIAANHEAICQQLGLTKPFAERGKYDSNNKKLGLRPFIVLCTTIVVVAASIGAWFGFEYLIQKQEEARYIANMERKQAEEEARRNRIEYGDIAFLESFPPNVAISMDGKQLYARSEDGSYTELRARESTWIRNLPIKGETILKFGFTAEGFKPLTRSVAYYDWFPSHKPGSNPLEKAFRKVVLEPDISPRVTACDKLPFIQDTSACEWTVFREIVFRERYAQAVKPLVLDEAGKRAALKSQLTLHPLLAEAAHGFDIKTLDTKAPIPNPELPDATKSLLKTLMDNPYGLYGAITVETDSPDTRVFFMSEPLMVIKSSGSMSQVRVDPDKPFTFAVYGQGKPIEITEKLSIRLETPDAPAYVTEIAPHQWRCTVPGLEQLLAIPVPAIAPEINSPDYRHFMCDYSIKISVNFQAIKAFEAEAAKQREAMQKAQETSQTEDAAKAVQNPS